MTAMGGDRDVDWALQAGASGSLLKGRGRQEPVDCIRNVASGRKCLQASASARLADRMVCQDLTAREIDALRGLVEGLSHKSVARRPGGAEGTVKTHMKGLLHRVQVRARAGAGAISAG